MLMLDGTAPRSGFRANLRGIITTYKKDFATVNAQERYKWEALGWYKQHWNLDAEDFAQMLVTAFGRTKNLLASSMYYPYKMICSFAQAQPETVRELFRMLYDESVPLDQRYAAFRRSCEAYTKPMGLNHYQDLRAIMVYLTFEYPERYYFYKAGMFKDFRERYGYEEEITGKSAVAKVESFRRMCDEILTEVHKDPELVAMSKARLDADCYPDEALHLLTMDIVFFGTYYMDENTPPVEAEPPVDTEMQNSPAPGTDIGLNTILYGPPGTGKTYHTVIYAVAIIENKPLAAVRKEPYGQVLQRYNSYKAQGRIAFTTFHQSFGYEEFIEGIRPQPDPSGSGDIRYDVMPGIFKAFCENAQAAAAGRDNDWGIRDNPTIWKVSLAGTGPNPIREDCMKNGHIRIGWSRYGNSLANEQDYAGGGRSILNAFINDMQIGDIVLSCFSEKEIDAIGVITDDYEWVESYPDDYKRRRKVNWLIKDKRENICQINGGKKMTLSTVYRLNSVSLSDVLDIVRKYRPQQPTDTGNRVFIIDEINRGNISRIFGELITLIEPSKRLGQPEAVRVVLPYSQRSFGVPGNIYIIGTMNTADRSIAAIDTALRRRFRFREMLPNPELLADVHVEDLSIQDLLVRMNRRISVLYDREHTIGHAYFMPLKASPTIDTLADIFENSIIPLLQEYFYEDYEKIRLVLADNQKDSSEQQFILPTENNHQALFGKADLDLDTTCSYEINRAAFTNPDAYRSI